MDAQTQSTTKRQVRTEISLGLGTARAKTPIRLEFLDPYYWLMEISWPAFIGAVVISFILLNMLFGLIYAALPGAVANASPGSLTDAFFFSVDTLATVGYGNMYPASRAGHAVAAAEILLGLFFLAAVTGLIFARFSRPRRGLLFSRCAVVGRYQGQRALMVRVAWTRSFPLLDAMAQLSWFELVTDSDGKTFRRLRELELVRSRNPLVGLGWTIIHLLPEGSDILECIERGEQVLLMASVSGTDMLLASPSHTVQRYQLGEIHLDCEFAEMVSEDAGILKMDLKRLHQTQPIG